MSKTRLFAALALIVSVVCASAQQGGPQLFGRQDFEMEWKVEPLHVVLSARYLAAKGMMRLEVLDGQSRAVLRSLPTGEALLLLRQGQGGAYSFKAPPMGRFEPGRAQGEETIGNERCALFTSGPVTLCLTDDGIPLKMVFPNGALTASRLLRQPQHPALFELPQGVKAQPLPSNIPPPQMPF